MAEPSQYDFDLNEVTIALIKQQGLHEGLWALGLELHMAVGAFGPTPAEARPGALVQVNRLHLTRQPPDKADFPGTVDAKLVNPERAIGVIARAKRR